ncbi:alpha/beta family hydrolase [Micromonospora sp. RTGN7]|uniref:alpha/beta hydrolase family protein n=1 Tax=Micromonospora sp. RTGN7 TaxID=3016526 RepID=UPI0029FF54E0|nr:alpha/beta family hydrolase [Micromonospora sp. RTGN7]
MRHDNDEIGTPRGPARVDTDLPAGPPRALLVLGHGAGGDVDAPDLRAVRDAAVAAGVAVVRVTQPYRLAGRRAPAPAGHLDEAWTAVVAQLRRRHPAVPALVVGGRSSGARVACRTAAAVGADAVLALAFPLHPPGRPERSRVAELATGLPTLVVNGDRDPFGVPDAGPPVLVIVRPGERHDLRGDPAGTAVVAVDWLRGHGWATGGSIGGP